jgi:hypothetical protein
MAILGVRLGEVNIIVYNQNNVNTMTSEAWLLLLIGYMLCFVFPFLSVRIVEKKRWFLDRKQDLAFFVHQDKVASFKNGKKVFNRLAILYTLTLGLILFCSIFIGLTLSSIGFFLYDSDFRNPDSNFNSLDGALYDSVLYMTEYPIFAWLLGGFVLSYLVHYLATLHFTTVKLEKSELDPEIQLKPAKLAKLIKFCPQCGKSRQKEEVYCPSCDYQYPTYLRGDKFLFHEEEE